ncbi:uncharacterized protein J3D65DRAFT_681068 [Phyllosticta citribraziliensis]|uniref:Retrotransposon gag domain-containing protein n=1 Tax=Phyllosticta citribraziliensis TaxID=989973 RepID=A0ABR1L707_9PEZI
MHLDSLRTATAAVLKSSTEAVQCLDKFLNNRDKLHAARTKLEFMQQDSRPLGEFATEFVSLTQRAGWDPVSAKKALVSKLKFEDAALMIELKEQGLPYAAMAERIKYIKERPAERQSYQTWTPKDYANERLGFKTITECLRNPLILPEHTPALDILVERRRLGQTNLQVKSGQVAGPSKQPEVTDLFDYAHLRVPLPKDLNGSGIFSLSSYILMRRSSDGFISATGMFNVGGPAFPWASQDDEEQERIYHKHPDERRRSDDLTKKMMQCSPAPSTNPIIFAIFLRHQPWSTATPPHAHQRHVHRFAASTVITAFMVHINQSTASPVLVSGSRGRSPVSPKPKVDDDAALEETRRQCNTMEGMLVKQALGSK